MSRRTSLRSLWMWRSGSNDTSCSTRSNRTGLTYVWESTLSPFALCVSLHPICWSMPIKTFYWTLTSCTPPFNCFPLSHSDCITCHLCASRRAQSKKFSQQFRAAFARREEGIRHIQDRLKGLTRAIEHVNGKVGAVNETQRSMPMPSVGTPEMRRNDERSGWKEPGGKDSFSPQ